MRAGTFVPYDADYLAVGEMLLNQVHRDFTFLHPDVLLSEKVKLNGSSLELVNQVNRQSYKVVILPGEEVISLKAMPASESPGVSETIDSSSGIGCRLSLGDSTGRQRRRIAGPREAHERFYVGRAP